MDQVRLRRSSPMQRETHPSAPASAEVSHAEHRKKLGPPTAPVHRRQRRRLCTVLLLCLVALLTAAGFIGYTVSRSPKDLDEQWEDVRSYAAWAWSRARGVVPPCTYAGVRHYAWGGAVDVNGLCDCWLRRCPPAAPTGRGGAAAPASRLHSRATVSTRFSALPTVDELWEQCAAAHSPVSRGSSARPIRVFEAPSGVVASGIFSSIRTPMCVQSARIYAVLPPNTSAITATYSLGDYENFFANLTDAVLKRGVKYHPLTTVPAAGVLMAVPGQTSSIYTLMHEGLRGWGAVLEEGFGAGFGTEEDARAWREANAQVLFLSDRSMDLGHQTAHSSEVTRRLANIVSRPAQSPFFSIAPLSRTRAGEVAREPMYCFCGGFVVPSVGVREEGALSEAGYRHLRRVAYEHFEGAPLSRDAAVAAASREATRVASTFYTSAVRAAWPPLHSAKSSRSNHRGASRPRRPRLLWVGRHRPRIVDENRMIAFAKSIGFDVYVNTDYTNRAGAAEQLYLARHADVIVGFHGVSLINAVWMDPTPHRDCRTLVEFLPYAQVKQVVRVYGEPAVAAGNAYVSIAPVDAVFVGPMYAKEADREAAKRELMGEDKVLRAVVSHPAFKKHRGIYNITQVETRLRELHAQLQRCL
ncbi:hypothetical protein NESM_000488300 [Novymonas esmeraldas]|uniref:Glycosyltransferase 61 catalytic domain-containing protein n=1 Tax=Novymonas esmeraldas TaxID=1808958 RepID=A0AAW0EQZ9_9TRYP